jgi:hypothetical protein
MPWYDLARVVDASRAFAGEIERHSRQFHAPGYDISWGAEQVRKAGSELKLALEDHTVSDPSDSSEVRALMEFSRVGDRAHVQCEIVRECLKQLLARINHPCDPTEGASRGSKPPKEGLEDRELELPELPHLIFATDVLRGLDKELGQKTPRRRDPTNTKTRAAKLKEMSKVDKAIQILNFRTRRQGYPINVEDIADDPDVGCTHQNLYKSKRFMEEHAEADKWRMSNWGVIRERTPTRDST